MKIHIIAAVAVVLALTPAIWSKCDSPNYIKCPVGIGCSYTDTHTIDLWTCCNLNAPCTGGGWERFQRGGEIWTYNCPGSSGYCIDPSTYVDGGWDGTCCP